MTRPIRRRGLLCAMVCLAAALGLAGRASAAPEEERAAALARATDLRRQALALSAQGRHAEAVPLAREAMALRERLLAADDPMLAQTRVDAGVVLLRAGEADEAARSIEAALPAVERLRGAESLAFAETAALAAKAHYAAGQEARAQGLWERALPALERRDDPGDMTRIEACERLGSIHMRKGDTEKAIPVFEKLIVLHGRAAGPNSPWVAQAQANLASCLSMTGRHAQVVALCEQALAVWRRAPEGLPATAHAVLRIHGDALHHLGRLEDARTALAEAAAEAERLRGPKSAEAALALRSLAHVLAEQGRLEAAWPLCERSVEAAEAAMAADDPMLAYCLATMAELLGYQRRYAQARPLLERIVAIYEARHGLRSPAVVEARASLATALRAIGETDAAVAAIEAAFGPDGKLPAAGAGWGPEQFGRLAWLYLQAGRAQDAEAAARRALEVAEATDGPEHLRTADAWRPLGFALAAQGRHGDARAAFERAVAISEAGLGAEHSEVAASLVHLAEVLAAQGETKAATEAFRRALHLNRRVLVRYLAGFDRAQRIGLAQSMRWGLDTYLAFALRAGVDAYEEVLRTKGLAAKAEALERRFARRGGEAGAAKAAALREAERRVARLANQVPSSAAQQAGDAWRTEYASALASRDEAARDLAQAFAASGGTTQDEATVERLQACIGPGEAVADILRSQERYVAWVVTHDGPVAQVDLGPAEPLERAAAAFVAAVRTATPAGASGAARGVRPADAAPEEGVGREARWHATGAALRAIAWAPIEAHLPPSTHTVWLSPDGALASVPFCALPGRTAGRTLLEETLLVFVASASSRIDRVRPRAIGPPGLFVGGVDYGPAEAHGPTPPPTPGSGPARALPRVRWDALPGTAREARILARLLEDPAGAAAATLEGREATEAALRTAVLGKRVLHLATHGFVREDLLEGLVGRAASAGVGMPVSSGLRLAVGHDPMDLCGLALAGANTGDGGDADDGILSGSEASHLDLDGCDLVTLSACETARGTTASGEGVLGLVRGFSLAGARAVVASLWPVDDEATQVLMTRFYEGLLRKDGSESVAGALREAALWLRTQHGRGGRAFAAPRDWAAFVAYTD